MPPQFSRYDTAVHRIFIGRSILASFTMKMVQALGHRNSRIFNKNTEASCGIRQILPRAAKYVHHALGGNSVTDSDILESAYSSK